MGAGRRVRQQVGVHGRMEHSSKACVASDNPAMYLWGLVKQGACSRVVAQHECTLCTMRVRLAETEEYLLQSNTRCTLMLTSMQEGWLRQLLPAGLPARLGLLTCLQEVPVSNSVCICAVHYNSGRVNTISGITRVLCIELCLTVCSDQQHQHACDHGQLHRATGWASVGRARKATGKG